jgi:hypothetical protein
MLRALAPKGASRVEPGDGDNGVIYGASVCTLGELLGHDLWADKITLDQFVEYGNRTAPRVKSRLAHPSLSSDGMGKLLARVKKFRREKLKVLADIHFLESASLAPSGDLAAYVMKVAKESPDLFGLSAVVKRDIGAEEAFRAKHLDEDGVFVSPDKDNSKGLTHLRIADLSAVDVVDENAGNPDGLFSRGSAMAAEADSLLEYAFSLTEKAPKSNDRLEIHPERAREFLKNFLARKHLSVVYMGNEVQTEGKAADPATAKPSGNVTSRKSIFTGRRSNTVDTLDKVIAEIPEEKRNICTLAVEQHIAKVKDEAVKAAVAEAVAPLNEELGTLRAQKDNFEQKAQQLEAEVKEHKANAEKERLASTVESKLSELITSGKFPETAREELKPLVTKMAKGEALTAEDADKYADLRVVETTLTTLTKVDGNVVSELRTDVQEKARESLRQKGFIGGAKR